jgi:malonyl-CoA/methylmalonyl-CoA synthetase
MTSNLYEKLGFSQADPDATAVKSPDGTRYSYGQFHSQSGKMANLLRGLGVRPGDRIAMQPDRTPDTVALYLSCLRTGAVLLPLNTSYTAGELDYILTDAQPKLFVTDASDSVSRSGISAQTRSMDDLRWLADEHDDAFSTVACAGDTLAALLYTSGTTGRPKGAELSHSSLSSNARALVKVWRFTPEDVLIHALPLYHAHGLFIALNTAFMAGATVNVLDGFDVSEVLRQLKVGTVLMGVPTFYTRMLDDPGLTRECTAAMRMFISGSAPLLPETHSAWLDRTGHSIIERYGLTETLINTSNPCDGERKAGSVGIALPDVEVRVGSALAEAAPAGIVGAIEVRGPNLCSGYWNRPAATRDAFRDGGWFVTGDLGLLDDEGYLYILGREKDLVITGGLNVYPKELEELIDLLPAVRESAVIGVPHDDFGEALVAVLVVDGTHKIDRAAIAGHLSSRVAKFKIPKQVEVVSDLPRNAMGKVEKRKLRDQFQDLFASE